MSRSGLLVAMALGTLPPVTVTQPTASIHMALAGLSYRTKLRLLPEERVAGKAICFRFHHRPVEAVLAAIANTGDWEWDTSNPEARILRERFRPHRMDLFRPHDEAEAEVYRQGRTLRDQIAGLAGPTRDALTFDNTSEASGDKPGVPFADLPGPIRGTLQAMLTAHLESQSLAGDPPLFDAGALVNARVRIQRSNPQPGMDDFTVDLIAPTAAGGKQQIGIGVVIFKDPREGSQVVSLASVGHEPDPRIEEDRASHEAAAESEPRLKNAVRLAMRRATFEQAVMTLSARTMVDVSAELEQGTPKRVSFNLGPMPLAELLDRLCERYSDDKTRITWGVRGDATLLFHRSEVKGGQSP